jgi:hypothetical protein
MGGGKMNDTLQETVIKAQQFYTGGLYEKNRRIG